MTIKFVQEREGCTKENLAGCLDKLEKGLKFGRIIVHRGVDRFIDNTCYVFCNVVKGLKIEKPEKVLHRIKIPYQLSLAQSEYKPLPSGSTGVLDFQSVDDKPLGQYFESNNVLWISDLTHIPDPRGAQPFGLVLDCIEAFKSLTDAEFTKWIVTFEKKIVWRALMLGADPEFEIAKGDGGIVSASSVFPHPRDRPEELGHDGHERIGELRTKVVDSPKKLTQEFKRLIRLAMEHAGYPSDGQMFVGGGTDMETGGHIHVSGMEVKDDLLDYLGVYIAAPMDQSQCQRRKESGFARWAKGEGERVRKKGEEHWEYRPLMAYHFDEKTTDAVHCTFYCILETYRRQKKSLVKDPKPKNYRDLWGYDEYKDDIDFFIERFVDGRTRMEGIDVLDRWFKDRPKRPYVKFISNQRANKKELSHSLAEFLKELNKERIEATTGLRVNIWAADNARLGHIGLSKGAEKALDAASDQWIGIFPEKVSNLADDKYGHKTWDFVFQVSWAALRKEAHRVQIAEAFREAIRISIGEAK